MNKIRVRVADWQKDNAELRRIREAVFVPNSRFRRNWSGTPKRRSRAFSRL